MSSNSIGDFKKLLKKMKSVIISSVISFFLLFSFSMGNVMNARASSGISGPNSAKAITKINKKELLNAVVNSKNSLQKSKKIVNVEFIIANGAAVSANAHDSHGNHEKPVKSVKKVTRKINRKRNKNGKNQHSLSDDLYDFEQEAEHEVKQSWESLTGSMKGQEMLFFFLGGGGGG